MTRRATAQDVADLAGVSRSAVSLVLNGRADGNISPAKQEAVREAARQLRYTPNAVALSLRSKRTGTIGVLTWRNRWRMPPTLLSELHTAASSTGYLLMTVDVVQHPLQVDALLDRRVDGFVVVAPELSEYHLPEVIRAVPTVLVNCFDPSLRAPALLTDEVVEGTSAVHQTVALVPDEIGAGATAVRHLLNAGHRELAVLAGVEGLASQRRLQGIRQALEADALPEPLVVPAGRTVGDGYLAARRLLSSDPPPTALLCAHERLVMGALLAAGDLGLRVPDDLSLVSMDDGEGLAGSLVPAIDLVERPDALIATHAFDLLVDQLRDGHTDGRWLAFVCPLRPGGSVSPPRLRTAPTG